MDHVTWATPLSGMVSRPNATVWYSLQAQNLPFSRSRDRHFCGAKV